MFKIVGSQRLIDRFPLRSFTLTEILVAVSVMTLLVLLVAKMVEGGNLVISGSRKHLSADSEARVVFSRFDLDVRQMPMRGDMDALFSANNSALFFISESPGSYASSSTSVKSTLTLIGYRVNQQAQLERLAKGLTWTNSVFLTYATNAPTGTSVPVTGTTLNSAWAQVVGTAPNYGDGTDTDYQVMAWGVFRMFYCFQKSDGSYTLTLSSVPPNGKFHNVAAIILTVAVLDEESRKMISSVDKLSKALPTPVQTDLDNGKLPSQLWLAAVNDTTVFANAAGIPVKAAANVRIYQRSFFLNQP